MSDTAGLPPPEAPHASWTFSQERFWLLEQLEPHNPAFASALAVHLPSPIEHAKLLAGLEALAQRRSILRTGFVVEGERATLSDRGHALVSIETRAVSGELSHEADGCAVSEARRGFELSEGPLARLVQLTRGAEAVLVLVAHGAFADRGTLARLAEELLSAVAAKLPPNDARTPRELAQSERAFAASDAGQALLSAARSRLIGCSMTLDLPTDRARREQRSYRAEAHRFALDKSELGCVDKLVKLAGVTRADVLLAGFGAVLSRYARQTELLIGERVELTAGEVLTRSLNTVVLRVSREGEPTPKLFLERVAAARKAAHGERALPFEALLAALSPARDPSRSPVFQVGFSYSLREPNAREALPVPVHTGALEVDLTLELEECGDAVTGALLFSTDLFDTATIERMRGHWTTLIARLSERPDSPLYMSSMLDRVEEHKVVRELNPTETFSGTTPLHVLVERAAHARPASIAVRYADTTLSYGELDRRANQLARRLRELGVRPDVRVLVCMDRSLELIVALLGILKAGGAYVPIEPTNPKDRIAFVLEDAKAPVAITQRAHEDKLLGGAAKLLYLDDLASLDELDGDALPPGLSASPESLAYVIYTSGSTGKPKGCLIEHRNVVRLFEATAPWYHFDEHDVWTMFHSVAFDFSVWEIWGALIYGGCVVVVPYSVTRSPDEFYQLCATEGVTVLNQTPSAFRQFIAAEQRTGRAELALRYVIFGGEALEFESLRPWFAVHGDQKPALVNMYGITETTVHVTYRPVQLSDLGGQAASAIGRAIPDLSLYVLDEHGQLVPVGVPGEIYVAGAGVARGYLDRPELTAARFMDCPYRENTRMYRTGDLARWLTNGELDYLGRIDQQVKIRGFRIELGEIEAVLRRSGLVEDVTVIAHTSAGEAMLAAYVVSDASAADLRAYARRELPEYMVPSAFVRVPAIPMTGNGKVDRQALPAPKEERTAAEHDETPPQNQLERVLAEVWCKVLGLDNVGIDEGFFDLGGNSLRVVAVATCLREQHGMRVPVAKLFQYTSIRKLAEQLGALDMAPRQDAARERGARARTRHDEPIAIIGMAGKFPGAADVETFWQNLCAGVESVTAFGRDGLDASLPADERNHPAYVAARPMLDGADMFDAAFFGVPAREAEITDPQQRVLLEVAWEALENAGYDPAGYAGLIGVYAGEFNSTYHTANVLTRPDAIERVGSFLAMVGNEKDFVATRIAHRLDLRGPAISVHTACSTSLVAVAQAFFALRTYQCDMALAGGVAITFPQRQGHVYDDGGMLCADGHCRPFDEAATGTMFGDGAAMVLLKRLSDAVADGDHVYAVIRGAATNNDGGHKMSFSAPTVEGQAQVIAMAQAVADVQPESIGYVEAHGTATPLGDPIEVEALSQAFRAGSTKKGFCGLGSVKSNVGHLTAAAGATGLIKATLSLEREQIPKTLHFTRPNPRIELADSPFYVVAERQPWPRGAQARRAGVSSFGVGGTNAHVILEEAPPVTREPSPAGNELLVLSARTPEALDAAALRLAHWLEQKPELPLADVAFTLARGRRAFAERRVLVAANTSEAIAALRAPRARPLSARAAQKAPELVFVFPGQGAQHPNMGRKLYEQEPVFRRALDRCAEIVSPVIGSDLRVSLFPARDDDESAAAILRETRITQPALFAVGYALSQLYASWGVRPQLLVGHSVGEFVAACLAEVMSLEDAVTLVAQRGRLMQSMPRGSMLSVRGPASSIEPRLPEALSLAASNSPQLCVVAGPDEAVDAFAKTLEAEGVASSRLQTSHAFHSAMMEPAVALFRQHVARVKLAAPRIPIVSTVTGALLTGDQAQDPLYWSNHLRATVRFADAIQTVWNADPTRVLLEVGPRSTATQLARQSARDLAHQVAIASLDGKTGDAERAALLRAVGQLWCHGLAPDFATFYGAAQGTRGGTLNAAPQRRRVPLPTYPFERKPYFIEPGLRVSSARPLPSTQPASSAIAAGAIGAGAIAADNAFDPNANPTQAGRPESAVMPTYASHLATQAAEALVNEQLRLMTLQLELLAAAPPDPLAE